MNVDESRDKRVLVIRSAFDDQSQDWPVPDAEIQTVANLEDALQKIQHESFDLIIAHPQTLANLDTSLSTQQASTVLNTIGQCVGVMARDGGLLWANDAFNHLGDEVLSKLTDWCGEVFESFRDPVDHAPRRFRVSTSGEYYYEVAAAPICNADQEVQQLALLISDVTTTRRMQRKIDAIDNAGRVLVRLDAQQMANMDVTERLALFEDKIVRFMCDLMHFSNFAIFLVDKQTQKLQLLLNYELPQEAVEVDLHVGTEGNGIVGYVAATGRSYICPNVREDPRFLPGIEKAGSSLTVPMNLDDEVMGVLDVESTDLDAFSDDDRQFAEIFGRYVAIALNTFDLLVTEQVTTTGKLASNVQTEISGPLNDILTDATTLMENYIGHDDLRHSLQAICDNVMRVKDAVKAVVEPTTGLLGRRDDHEVDPVLNGRRVLIADDEVAILDTISEVLTSFGCNVETAHDGAEAIRMINARQYDVVLSDIKMPKKNGYEVFSAAKDRRAECAVILMTGFGYDPNHTIIRARQEGLSAVLFKPFKVDQLLSELRTALHSGVDSPQ